MPLYEQGNVLIGLKSSNRYFIHDNQKQTVRNINMLGHLEWLVPLLSRTRESGYGDLKVIFYVGTTPHPKSYVVGGTFLILPYSDGVRFWIGHNLQWIQFRRNRNINRIAQPT